MGFESVCATCLPTNNLQQPPILSEAASEVVNLDSDLKVIVEVWALLPLAIKAGILAMIQGSEAELMTAAPNRHFRIG